MKDNPHNPFKNHDDRVAGHEPFFDPTLPSMMQSCSGAEIPAREHCTFTSGTRHPSKADLTELTCEPESGSIILPKTIPLLNQDGQNPLKREPIYGCDLVIQSRRRAAHTIVIGPTGSGKNTTVIDPLRFSAIASPNHTVVSFSLKASDYGPIKVLCDQVGKKMVVVNLNDAWRSVGWNALATNNLDEAVDRIRQFVDSSKNPASNDSEFWAQWIKTGLTGAWQAGYRSFPAKYELFSLPSSELQEELRRHNNPHSRQLADFLAGGSHNADTVLASIIGALSAFLSANVKRVLSRDELMLDKALSEPICLHIEMPETSLETQRVLYQLLARSVVDALIEKAENTMGIPLPATVVFDDFPSLGNILNPKRMLTMRSRNIGILAGVQSISSLELAYGPACGALIDNFQTKIILPGGPACDAEFFSRASGEQMLSLPTYSGKSPSFMTRPLISAADIRTPSYYHPLFGKPATLMLGAMTFQAYLQRTYDHPWMASLLRRSAHITGREKLRKKRLALPRYKKRSAQLNTKNV